MLSHRLILHGRRMCHSRKPACGACPVARWCPSYGIGPTDEATASKLVKSGRGGRGLVTAARLLALVAVVVAMPSACTSSSSHEDTVPPLPTPPSYEQLVAAAHLDPCPTATGATGGGNRCRTSCCRVSAPARVSAFPGCAARRPSSTSGVRGARRARRRRAPVPGLDEAKPRVRFLGVDTEDEAKSALDFAPHVSPPMRYPQVFDESKKLLLALHLPSAVPTTVFVTASGRVVKVSPGP